MIRTAAARLEHERKNWRRDPDRPIGMWMRLADNEEDGSQSIFKWECGIPGPEGTNWEGGEYRIRMDFPQDYPFKPPRCKFVPPLFHPNVYPSGTICLRILNHDADWTPTVTFKDMLRGILELLDNPDINNPAQIEAYHLIVQDQAGYDRRVLMEARSRPPARKGAYEFGAKNV